MRGAVQKCPNGPSWPCLKCDVIFALWAFAFPLSLPWRSSVAKPFQGQAVAGLIGCNWRRLFFISATKPLFAPVLRSPVEPAHRSGAAANSRQISWRATAGFPGLLRSVQTPVVPTASHSGKLAQTVDPSAQVTPGEFEGFSRTPVVRAGQCEE